MKQFKKKNTFSKRDSSSSGKRDSPNFRTGESKFGERRPNRFDDGDFDRAPSRFGGRDFGGRSGGSGGSVEFHSAICDKCGAQCDVPFRPTGNKPIYCRTCFKQNESVSPRSNSYQGSYEPVNPRGGRPNNDFRQEERSNTSGASAQELEKLNKKLDKIMKALGVD